MIESEHGEEVYQPPAIKNMQVALEEEGPRGRRGGSSAERYYGFRALGNTSKYMA
jgi:hypothetical protein